MFGRPFSHIASTSGRQHLPAKNVLQATRNAKAEPVADVVSWRGGRQPKASQIETRSRLLAAGKGRRVKAESSRFPQAKQILGDHDPAVHRRGGQIRSANQSPSGIRPSP